MQGPTYCRSCKAEIVWIDTEKGRLMPCDPTVLQVVTATGTLVHGRISHWATCPTAEWHRKKKA